MTAIAGIVQWKRQSGNNRVAPDYDVGEITALAGASLTLEMLYIYASR